jgi:hypothetical protein
MQTYVNSVDIFSCIVDIFFAFFNIMQNLYRWNGLLAMHRVVKINEQLGLGSARVELSPSRVRKLKNNFEPSLSWRRVAYERSISSV